jgi:VIT1/CCC1 family predicted Fe2+/Mn2+ transporter
MKILQGLTGTITSLTNVVIALLGLGVVLALLGGGNVPFLGEVANNIVGLVQGLGDAGIVGLIAAIVILNFYK